VSDALAFQAAQNALTVAIELAGPLLIGSLAIGLTISILQAVMQINDSTLSYVPRLAVVIGLLALLAPWMAHTMVAYITGVFAMLPSLARA
jgi:flagellar biosynthesis protein FliQ